jgi:hypothetical protein
MKRLWIALVMVAVLRLLFVSSFERAVPWILWTTLFIAALVVGISLIFSFEIPLLRRLAISYLTLTGLAYSLAGFLGLFPRYGLVETQMWYTCLVSPNPAVTLLVHGIPDNQHDMRWAYIGVTPLDDPHTQFSAAVLVLGSVALVAAIGLAWRKRAAYGVWLVLVGFFTLCTVGYGVASNVGWGMGMKGVTLPLGLTASYMAALFIARMNMSFDENPRTKEIIGLRSWFVGKSEKVRTTTYFGD